MIKKAGYLLVSFGYVLIAVFMVLSYAPAKEVIIRQSAWEKVVMSNITVNFVLLFFLWGMLADRISKSLKWNTRSWKSWFLFSAGLIAMMLLFRFAGGMLTIFD